MKRLAGLYLALTCILCAGNISITILPSVAPNAYGSPSYPDYVTNATYALENGLSSYGTPGTPSYYQQQSTVDINQMIVTGFPSWLSQTDPGTVFGSAFANELGNRPLFGLVINGNGTQFSISELSFTASSNDPGNLLGFTFGTGSYNYSSNYVGIIFGSGGGANTYITSGSNTQLVDEIVGRGSGNADAAYCPPAPATCTIAAQQAAIAALAPDFNGMTQFSGTYTLTTAGNVVLASGTSLLDVTAPEPGSAVLFGTGALLVLFGKKRRSSAFRSGALADVRSARAHKN